MHPCSEIGTRDHVCCVVLTDLFMLPFVFAPDRPCPLGVLACIDGRSLFKRSLG